MTIEEIEEKITELEKLQAETENLHAELKTQIAELKAQNKEKLTPPHPRWEPHSYEHYYFYDSTGAVDAKIWCFEPGDIDRYILGNVFMQRSDAEFAVERLKVLAQMRKWAGHNYDGAYIYYHKPSDEIMIDWDGDSTNCHGDIRFKCVDDALNCIKSVGKDRIKKYYFGIIE